MRTIEQSMFLTIPELRLSLKLQGYETWNDLPLLETEESIEQRLMNTLLQLIQKGHFEPFDGGYRMEKEFRQVVTWIGQADNVYQIWEEECIVAFVYEKDGKFVLVSPDIGRREVCKITILENYELTEVVNAISENAAWKTELILKKAEQEKEETDINKLLYYYGTVKIVEETE